MIAKGYFFHKIIQSYYSIIRKTQPFKIRTFQNKSLSEQQHFGIRPFWNKDHLACLEQIQQFLEKRKPFQQKLFNNNNGDKAHIHSQESAQGTNDVCV